MKIIGELKYRIIKNVIETINHVFVYPDINISYYFPVGTLETRYYLDTAPWLAMFIVKPDGKQLIPYLVLESAYRNGLLDRKRVDKCFKSMLKDTGASKVRAHITYLLVRLCSGSKYKAS